MVERPFDVAISELEKKDWTLWFIQKLILKEYFNCIVHFLHVQTAHAALFFLLEEQEAFEFILQAFEMHNVQARHQGYFLLCLEVLGA